MTLTKAREYFSAYYEGSLDRGLREGFERALKADAQLTAEYRAFERTMERLEAFGTQTVEPPEDLHDRILARIDYTVWEKKQRTATPLGRWKSLLLIGGAAAAITFAAMQAAPGPDTTKAGIGIASGTKARLDVHSVKSGVSLDYLASGRTMLTIYDEQGNRLETVRIQEGQAVRNKLITNLKEGAEVIKIEVGNSATWIALPGTKRGSAVSGKGTVGALAKAIAEGCGVPVVLQVADANVETSWLLDTTDAHSTAQRAVESLGKKVELRGDRSDPRTLWILDN